MNKSSLAHSDVENQRSWIDEAFSYTPYPTKGAPVLSHKRALANYAEVLVYQFGTYFNKEYTLFLDDLCESDQNELVRLFMEATDRETNECVHGNDFSIDNDYTCALLAMLKDNCVDTREHFAEVTRKNIITYYSKSLQEVIDEACHDLICTLSQKSEVYYND